MQTNKWVLTVTESVTEVYCGILKETGASRISILEEVIFELNNTQFNLENVFLGKKKSRNLMKKGRGFTMEYRQNV